ncbi:transcription-repair coupling factor [Helcococcus kunzii]|uniref:transcription-repair coupling factor n=1 Tax=Helcococcus kunzii TaxID=40091 RepID=UPI001BAEF614|nr:transcription-repair coupling factor [Helcococcus kunzii]QUY64520.1 transcription-repair coupling factor [Helcococcus kunzii]
MIMEIQSYTRLQEAINEKYKLIYAHGVIEQATGHFIYKTFSKMNRSVFVLAENDRKARKLYENLLNNGHDVNYFPELEINYQLMEDLDFTNRKFRLKTIKDLIEDKKKIIVSSLPAIIKKIANKDYFNQKSIYIDYETEINVEEFSNKLVNMGYQRRNIIAAKGEFAIRGDIIDVFQVHEDNPTRLELFDIDVDSIRKFDINTQMSIEDIEEFTVFPIYENSFDIDNIDEIINNIRLDLQNTKNKFSDVIYDKSQFKFGRMIEKLEYEHEVDNIDLAIPYLQDDNFNIIDYLPKDAIILFDDFTNIETNYEKVENFRITDIQERIENGDLLSKHHNIFYSFNEILKKISSYKIINISALLKSLKRLKPDKIIEFNIRENLSYHGKFDDFISDLRFLLKNEYITKIFIENIDDAKNLQKLLMENKISSDIIIENEEPNHDVIIEIGYLSEGFTYFKDKVNFIAYNQIFNKIKKQKSRTVKNKDIINYSDLVKGDLLVHDSYGIGEFVGIKNIELNNIKSDFIELIYSGSDKLFVPTTDMSMVSKFVGNGDRKPALSNLSGVEWKKTKTKVKKAIEKIADDLVELYAKRSQIQGFKFSEDTPWQGQFEDSFEYQETDAQLRAVKEIKEDMESSIVMDRLLCGDVGYGKTEVALRAAFKAIMDGKQVVMLAPTTILVNQHFNTMKKRFAEFPITIDYLSRFKTQKQKQDVIEGLRKGRIDFVVGTHALISDKVVFKNLGLLIVDEEQRFGVKHKEKIKKASESIDVLTLSATPIPRTLQMSLSGIRDLSILDEYPQNRLPVNTYVMEYDPVYIREAILREINRNGQVYFVYNKVNSIHRMYERLIELVPEARIAISHGQMSTRQLETILGDFTDYKYDVLLTTTIIETGMDIQNVNTIIVYNADMMGLSQLYQLKGRVGRSDRNAFAYFSYKQNKVMTEIAEKRLKAIKDFTELGSGYKVAMRDLELRGAGNLLGESQSGHIESIGYDLYMRMLKETIDEIKGTKSKKREIDIKIDLNLDVYIPNNYINDENEKINIYKKISTIENSQDHYNIIDELTDRFGDVPKSVQNIIDIAYIKALIIENDFSEVIEIDNKVLIKYANIEIFDFEKLKLLSEKYKGNMSFDLVENPTIIIANDKSYTIKLIDLLELITKINKGEIQ